MIIEHFGVFKNKHFELFRKFFLTYLELSLQENWSFAAKIRCKYAKIGHKLTVCNGFGY